MSMTTRIKYAGSLAAGAAFGGLLVGAAEALYRDVSIPYAALMYGTLWAFAGAGGALALGIGWRRPQLPAGLSWWGAAAAVSLSAVVLLRFIVKRDVFAESSAGGIIATVIALVAAAGLGVGIMLLGRRFHRAGPGRATAWIAPFIVAIAFGGVTRGASDDALPTEPPSMRNLKGEGVILVLVDTLRADVLGAYGAGPHRGEAPSPHIDAFADTGVVFQDVCGQASWTKPATASIMTSRHASGHGTMSKPAVLPDSLPSLASELQGAGVETAAVVTNYNLEEGYGFSRGFDTFEYLPPARYLGAPARANRLAAYNVYRMLREKLLTDGRQARHFYRDGNVVNSLGLHILDEIGDGKFFLWLHYMEPHDPYFDIDGKSYARVSHRHPPLDWADPMRLAYRDDIVRFDTFFGELLDQLEQRDLTDRVTVVFVSDHGEEFGDHGSFWHGTTLYEEQLHVPLIIRGPGVAPGIDARLARQIDVAPTILSRFGLTAPSSWEGRDLLGESEEPTYAVAEEDHEGNQLRSIRYLDPQKPFKLILANPNNPRGVGEIELFDMAKDPGETAALSPAPTAMVDQLTEQLTLAQTQSKEGGAVAQERQLDADALEALKSLGYVED